MQRDEYDNGWQKSRSARHEAGHGVAALHYDCPFQGVTIENAGDSLGKFRQFRFRYLGDLVAIMCGPLAEYEWKAHRAGIDHFDCGGTDGRFVKKANADEIGICATEALRFMRRRAVQQQIDRVARALLERTTLTAHEVRELSGFTRPLCTRGFGDEPD